MKRILLVMLLFAFLLSAGIGKQQTMTVKAAAEVCGECNAASWALYHRVIQFCETGDCYAEANSARCYYVLNNCAMCDHEVVLACFSN
jgi:hypothetical protein